MTVRSTIRALVHRTRPATAGVAVVALAGILLAVLAGLVVAPASAGDSVALFYVEPGEPEVDAGETVTVDVMLQTYGGYEGEGVEATEVSVAYDPDVLTATDVEPGPFLEDEDGATVESETAIDAENGTASIAQWRAPPGEGVTGTEPVATVTFEVAADAPPTNATLELTDRSVDLVSGHPQATMGRDATVVIEGGAPDASTDDGADEPEGVTLADESSDDESSDESAGDRDGGDGAGDDGDPIPGFGPPIAVGTLVLVSLALAGRRRR